LYNMLAVEVHKNEILLFNSFQSWVTDIGY